MERVTSDSPGLEEKLPKNARSFETGCLDGSLAERQVLPGAGTRALVLLAKQGDHATGRVLSSQHGHRRSLTAG